MRSTPPVVLLVAQHQEMLAMYAISLMAMGIHPVVAEDADEAFARACRLCPDVVVADISLPETSRLALIRQLHDDARTRTAGIIVIDGANAAADAGNKSRRERSVLTPSSPAALGMQILDLIASRDRASSVIH